MEPPLNAAFWKGRRVLITGHTGFKGAWLTLWLSRLGATVRGYALAPDSICLEITESALMDEPELALRHLNQLRERVKALEKSLATLPSAADHS